MTLPTPQNLEDAPLWENYVVAQLTQAALGLVPESTLAFGVEVNEFDLVVVCQVPEAAPTLTTTSMRSRRSWCSCWAKPHETRNPADHDPEPTPRRPVAGRRPAPVDVTTEEMPTQPRPDSPRPTRATGSRR